MALAERTLAGTKDVESINGFTLSGNPTGMQEGDWLYAEYATLGGAVTHAAPTGWTSIGSAVQSGVAISMWRKLCGATEAGPYQFDSGATANRRQVLSFRAWSGGDPTNPIDAVSGAVTATSATSLTHTALTSGGAGRVWVLATAKGTPNSVQTTLNTPSGFTELVDHCSNNTAAVANINAGRHVKSVGSGSTGTQQVTSPDGTSQTWVGIGYLLSPAGAQVLTAAADLAQTATMAANPQVIPAAGATVTATATMEQPWAGVAVGAINPATVRVVTAAATFSQTATLRATPQVITAPGGPGPPPPPPGPTATASDIAVFDGVNAPRPVVEIAAGAGAGIVDPGPEYLHLGVGPGLGTGMLWGPTFTDTSADLLDFSINPAEATPGEPLTPRRATLTLRNDRGDYVLDGGLLELDSTVRIRAEWPLGTLTTLYVGVIDDIVPDDSPPIPTVTLALTDGLAVLGRRKLAPLQPPGFDNELTGARVGHILDGAAWPTSQRQLDTGLTRLQTTTMDDFAVPLLERVVTTELGWLFVDRDGTVQFWDRYHTATAARSVTVQAIYTDAGGLTGLERSKGRDLFWNHAALTRQPVENVAPPVGQDDFADDPQTQEGFSFSSVQRFGLASYPREAGTLLRSDLDVKNMAEWLAGRNATPTQRVSQVTVRGTGFSQWDELIGTRRGDRIRVLRTYGATSVDVELLVSGEGMAANLSARSWDFTFATITPPPGRPASALRLGHGPGLGAGTLNW